MRTRRQFYPRQFSKPRKRTTGTPTPSARPCTPQQLVDNRPFMLRGGHVYRIFVNNVRAEIVLTGLFRRQLRVGPAGHAVANSRHQRIVANQGRRFIVFRDKVRQDKCPNKNHSVTNIRANRDQARQRTRSGAKGRRRTTRNNILRGHETGVG